MIAKLSRLIAVAAIACVVVAFTIADSAQAQRFRGGGFRGHFGGGHFGRSHFAGRGFRFRGGGRRFGFGPRFAVLPLGYPYFMPYDEPDCFVTHVRRVVYRHHRQRVVLRRVVVC